MNGTRWVHTAKRWPHNAENAVSETQITLEKIVKFDIQICDCITKSIVYPYYIHCMEIAISMKIIIIIIIDYYFHIKDFEKNFQWQC
jgi:hypothetical protein